MAIQFWSCCCQVTEMVTLLKIFSQMVSFPVLLLVFHKFSSSNHAILLSGLVSFVPRKCFNGNWIIRDNPISHSRYIKYTLETMAFVCFCWMITQMISIFQHPLAMASHRQASKRGFSCGSAKHLHSSGMIARRRP